MVKVKIMKMTRQVKVGVVVLVLVAGMASKVSRMTIRASLTIGTSCGRDARQRIQAGGLGGQIEGRWWDFGCVDLGCRSNRRITSERASVAQAQHLFAS